MSRSRGIEVKVQKEVLQTRKYGLNEILKKKPTATLHEDQTENSKEVGEKKQIQELLHKLPKLDEIFDVHGKIGEGTFSSVYLGSLKQHSTLPESEKRWFAIKHLVPTAHPARIEHELRCLQDMGGKEHVIGVELCLRNLDTIVFVMPYIPHRKFSEYVSDMDAEELRQYMRALLTALRHVHSFGVIHRDVKPSNFLYDRENRRYLLVDFGLAQRLLPATDEPDVTPGTKRPREQDSLGPRAKRAALASAAGGRPEAGGPCVCAGRGAVCSACRARPGPRAGTRPEASGPCVCAGRGAVCSACRARPAPRAARAGTQGFRPPEVLLKSPRQSTAVDAWAAGVVLASALTGRYPFFRAADDVSALAELADLLGTEPLRRAASSLGRRLVTSSPRHGLCLRRLAASLRGAAAPCDCRLPQAERGPACGGEAGGEAGGAAGFPGAAFSLASRLLEADPAARITAADALRHPFLAPPAPHPHL